MATAFQANAFQNNAFQIDDVVSPVASVPDVGFIRPRPVQMRLAPTTIRSGPPQVRIGRAPKIRIRIL